jgi:hypothetical protein
VTGAAADTTADAADVTGAAADATGAGAAGAELADGAGAGAAGAELPEAAGAELAGAAVAVTAEAAEPAAEVTAEAAGLAAGAELVAGAVAAGVPVPGPEPVPEPEPAVAGATCPVTAEVVLVTAEVTVPEPGLEAGAVAACACRENTSKTTRIPAAAIATCIARRAMCRTIGCGMSSSPTTRQTGPGSSCPSAAARNAQTNPCFRLFRWGHPEPDICVRTEPYRNVHAVRPPPYSTDSGQARERRITADLRQLRRTGEPVNL